MVGCTRKGGLWLRWDGEVGWEVWRGDGTECSCFEHIVEASQY